jgi:hypothetical protein
MSKTLATYYRTGARPKAYACAPGAVEGTVDLLDDEGAVIVSGCQVIDDPETAANLPDGYATLVEPVKAAPPAKTKKAGKKSVADEDPGEP